MRRRRVLTVALLFALAPISVSMPCAGQSGDDAATIVARARFKEGVDFYDKNDFERARASFLQAYALKKHPAVLLNLAWSCLKSGHPLEAERYFKQFPADSKDVSDRQRADAADGLSQSRAKVGRIEVVAASGAEVIVDGEHVGLAPLPEPVEVEPGSHTVKTRGGNGTVDVQSITISAGEQRVARFGGASSTGGPPTGEIPAIPNAVPVPEASSAAGEDPRALPSDGTREPVRETPPNEGSPEKSFFPSNMVPVYLGGLITLAGTGMAIAMLEFKQNALDSANATAGNVRSQGRVCPPPSGSSDGALVNACSVLSGDNDQINQDATAGNIAVAVAAGGLVGTVSYWIFAHKDEVSGHASSQNVVLPIIGRSMGGLSLSGTF